MVKVSGVGLLALWKEKKVRMFRLYHSDLATQMSAWPTGEASLIIQNVLFCGFPLAVVYAMFVLHHELPNES